MEREQVAVRAGVEAEAVFVGLLAVVASSAVGIRLAGFAELCQALTRELSPRASFLAKALGRFE